MTKTQCKSRKTKAQLIDELMELRQRISELETVEPELMPSPEGGAITQALLNATTDRAMLIDAHGIILQVNDAMASRFNPFWKKSTSTRELPGKIGFRHSIRKKSAITIHSTRYTLGCAQQNGTPA